jgi:hypothetical protein
MSETPKYSINEEGMNKNLYDLLKENNVKSFELRFSGGSDEGYLDVHIEYDQSMDASNIISPTNNQKKTIESVLYDAAMEGFAYSGAGDGTPYGDNYYFDLETGEIRHEEWYMEEKSNMLPEKRIQVIDI